MESNKPLSQAQVSILTKFIKNQGLKYSAARPGRINNDDFKYHLKTLVVKGYLQKIGSEYELTEKGKLFGFQINPKGEIQEKFWVHVVSYVTRENQGRKEILLQRKMKHPYFGDIYGISGKIHSGEPLEKAAARKLTEETGLECKFKIVGTIRRVRKNLKGEIIQDAFFYHCYGEKPTGKLVAKNIYGENFWTDFNSAINFHENNLTAGKYTTEIIRRLQRNNFDPFYFHEEITLKSV